MPGVASPVDADEARRVGTAAIRAVTDDGQESGSVALRRLPGDRYASETFITPLETVAKRTRHLEDRFLSPAGNDITAEFVSYAKPLVGELPVIGHFSKRPVPKKLNRS
jgi:6-phosphofructokinase 1